MTTELMCPYCGANIPDWESHSCGGWTGAETLRLRASVERLTAERDAARAWARLWKRAAILSRLAVCGWWWQRHNATAWVTEHLPLDKRGQAIRRALGLDRE